MNWTRRKSRPSARAVAFATSVLATPGTPSSSTWPPTSTAATQALDDLVLADDDLPDLRDQAISQAPHSSLLTSVLPAWTSARPAVEHGIAAAGPAQHRIDLGVGQPDAPRRRPRAPPAPHRPGARPAAPDAPWSRARTGSQGLVGPPRPGHDPGERVDVGASRRRQLAALGLRRAEPAAACDHQRERGKRQAGEQHGPAASGCCVAGCRPVAVVALEEDDRSCRRPGDAEREPGVVGGAELACPGAARRRRAGSRGPGRARRRRPGFASGCRRRAGPRRCPPRTRSPALRRCTAPSELRHRREQLRVPETRRRPLRRGSSRSLQPDGRLGPADHEPAAALDEGSQRARISGAHERRVEHDSGGVARQRRVRRIRVDALDRVALAGRAARSTRPRRRCRWRRTTRSGRPGSRR